MTPEGIERLKLDEGRRLKAYQCSAGTWTIGYGHTGHVIPGMVITEMEADALLDADIAEAEEEAARVVPGFQLYHLTSRRRDALVNMAFNLGGPRLAGFHTFLRCVAAMEWAAAASALTTTLWHRQVGRRALRIEEDIREG